jgi:hypothetical protein
VSSGNSPVTEEDHRRAGQSPFARLVRHCLDRVLHGDNSEPGELDLGIGTILGLLAAPGAFASIFLADKYGSLFHFLRGEGKFDAYVASLPDEYFFIVLAMVVTGAVAVWKWDALIPDRRDYANLAPLPIRTVRIFSANFAALLLLASALAFDVNAASSIVFPLLVCGSEPSIGYTAVFFGTHLLAVVLASLSSFFIVLAILGLLAAMLPYRLFRRCSVYARCGMMIFLMAMLSTSFLMVKLIEHLSRASRPLVELLSPVWFLGLCQHLRGIANPAFGPLARVAIIAAPSTVVVAFGAYALSYRRCFTESTEVVSNFAAAGGRSRHYRFDRLDSLFLKSPFERAGFRFALKTLFRSENHTLVVGGSTGLGIVIASQTLFEAARKGGTGLPSADLLSIPLIVGYCLFLGLRFSFEIPVALRANWMFRMTVNPETHECVPLARRVMLAFLVPLLLLVCLPAYALGWGWELALTHTAVVAVLCWLLIEILLLRFRKIPFTCSTPTFKSSALVSVLLYVIGFAVFTSWTTTAERWALDDPLWYVPFALLLAAVWLILERYRREMTYLDQQLIFEERPETAVEVLDLTFSR